MRKSPLPLREAGFNGKPSSVGVDQCAEHFIRSLGNLDPQFHLNLAHGHIDHAAGQVRTLAAIHAAQTIDLIHRCLRVGRALNGAAGDLAGTLIDTILPGLNGVQPGIESAVPGNFMGELDLENE